MTVKKPMLKKGIFVVVYFHMLERTKGIRRRILWLQDDYGNWLGNPECLLIMAMKFFTNLEQPQVTNVTDFNWSNLGLIGLTQEQISWIS